LKYFQIQFEAITLCYEKKFINPVLILIYSTLDTLSYLDRVNDEETVKERFIRWVDTFLLLPNSKLKCSSIDLYAARCGMVHSSTAESNLSKDGKAKEIYYAIGHKDSLTEIIKRMKKEGEIVVIKIPELFLEFHQAYFRYLKYLSANDKLPLFIERINKIMAENDNEEFEILDRILPKI
jgi:hypothetical protein